MKRRAGFLVPFIALAVGASALVLLAAVLMAHGGPATGAMR